MSSICIIDTSVFCNILKVPKKSQWHEKTIAQFRRYNDDSYTFLLPMATIYETGNHIAQNGDGQVRRKTAELFVQQVTQAFQGQAPWTPTPFDSSAEFSIWLSQFPDQAMRGSGLGDLSIIKVFERQCELHPHRRIFIWSYDSHLRAYNREL
ncbi:MAG: hypothetical protein KDE50_18420 [Caldilineaceae bacterium]|nr:hypothetical protein [Caldilineaceae bacterium]MCB9149666.1 hypothetical protein [Caldilineaceae bacterium]